MLRRDTVLDLTSRRSIDARRVILDVARERPERVKRLLGEAIAALKGVRPLTSYMGFRVEQRVIRYYRPVRPPDPRRIEPVLRRVYEEQPRTMEELVLIRGVGPATLRALALIAELVYGAEASHDDPAVTDPLRYAFAVGGKDGYPYPFDARTAEEAAAVLEQAVMEARLGRREKIEALKRLRRLLSPPV